MKEIIIEGYYPDDQTYFNEKMKQIETLEVD